MSTKRTFHRRDGESNLPDDIAENAEFADALRPVGLHPRPHHVVRDDRR